MKTEKQLRINVRYKGDTFILQPGHKVYECNIDTGIVKEHQLKKSFWSRIFFWTEPVFEVDYKHNLIHRPFFDIDKAVTGFNQMCRQLIIERKKEGKRLVIKKAALLLLISLFLFGCGPTQEEHEANLLKKNGVKINRTHFYNFEKITFEDHDYIAYINGGIIHSSSCKCHKK